MDSAESASARIARSWASSHKLASERSWGAPLPVKQLATKVPKPDWVRAVSKQGSQGPIVSEFAFLHVTEARSNLPAAERWLIIRRKLPDPTEIKYYFSHAPVKTPLHEFVRLSGMSWPMGIFCP